jgi:hypothetical protein
MDKGVLLSRQSCFQNAFLKLSTPISACQVIDWEEREPLFRRLESITESQLAQRHLTTVGPYYSLLSPFDQEQMLGIAESHASRAHQRVAWMLPGD